MKTFKKTVSLMLALLLLTTLCGSVFAAQEGTLTGGSITISNAVEGQKYSAYQILYLESYDTSANAYSYKANSAWAAWLATQTTYLSIDAQGYVTWVEGADAAAFAKLAQEQAKTMVADASATADSTGSVTLSDLKLGYYLVDTTLGTLCSLDTTNPTAAMEEKNEVPENVKKVKEDSGTDYTASNDAEIGQTIEFQSTITARAGAENYVLHDKMDSQLTFEEVTGVTLNGTPVDASNYTVKTSDLAHTDCTFEVVFTQAFCDTLKDNDQIVVSYTAYLNASAGTGFNYINRSYLSYGDATNIKDTATSETTSKTWSVKVAKQDTNGTSLANAKFVISTSAEEVNAIKLISRNDNTYRLALDTETESAITEITTGESGQFEIVGLDSSDVYYLIETEAPSGYNKLKAPIKFVLDASGHVKYGFEAEFESAAQTNSNLITVINKTGTELPSTGGMGTTLFYVLGSVLVLGAIVLLVTRKRMRTEE